MLVISLLPTMYLPFITAHLAPATFLAFSPAVFGPAAPALSSAGLFFIIGL